MRLTRDMWTEVDVKSDRIKAIRDAAYTNMRSTMMNHRFSFYFIQMLHREELEAHKIRLEILFSETDIKEQSKISTRNTPRLLLKSVSITAITFHF